MIHYNADRLSAWSYLDAQFFEMAVTRGFRHVARYQVATAVDAASAAAMLGGQRVATADGCGEACILDGGATLVLVEATGVAVRAIVASNAGETAHVHELLSRLPPLTQPAGDAIRVSFWVNTHFGPQSITRDIAAPTWGEIAPNYSYRAAPKVERLMSASTAPSAGRLLLLHGPPGTGKTYILRALARAWQPWCDAHYVVDADEFFESASYMLTVALDSLQPERWRLVVLEDADEYLREEGKRREGQAVSRLLNILDGFVGQGTNVLFAMTTNEKVEAFNPAVTRPGRCFAEVEVPLLTSLEAGRWLDAHGGGDTPSADVSLASLYAQVAGQDEVTLPLTSSQEQARRIAARWLEVSRR